MRRRILKNSREHWEIEIIYIGSWMSFHETIPERILSALTSRTGEIALAN